MSRPRFIALLLAFATLLVYLPVGRFSFLDFDDPTYVTSNSQVICGLTGADISWAFTAFHAGNWHPLTWLSHMLDCQLFGPNAGAQHFVNVLWHALNVMLLFLWLTQLTGRMGPAMFIAALFAWHPLHVESVAWISERKDVLSTGFALLTLLAYTHYAQNHDRRSLWLALIAFTLGLLAKPMLVTLPCVLLLLDYWPLQRLIPFKKALLEKMPFFALTVISCVVTFIAQHRGEAVLSLAQESLWNRLENAPLAVAGYLGKLFMPVDLCVLYPLREHIPLWQVALAVTVLAVISAIAWNWRSKRPYFLMGWLWFLGMLVPVIGLVQVGVQAMADRYMYIPSIGFFIAGVFLLAEWAERMQTPRAIETGFAAVICSACILGTEYQLPFWQDSETLFRRAIAVTTNNDVAHLNLGAALASQGRYDEAIEQFQDALRIRTGWYQIHNNIGMIMDIDQRPAEAVAEFRQAIQLDPRIPAVHNNLGATLVELGQYAEAQKEFAEAERLDPQYAWPHVETAKLLLAQGRDVDAVAELRTAIQLQPDNDEILAYAAHVLAADKNAVVRDGHTALMYALKANLLNDHSPMILDALGMALAENGDYTNAVACAQNALQMAQAARMKETNAMQQRLEFYQANQPWRESFLATNAPASPAIKFDVPTPAFGN